MKRVPIAYTVPVQATTLPFKSLTHVAVAFFSSISFFAPEALEDILIGIKALERYTYENGEAHVVPPPPTLRGLQKLKASRCT